MSLFQQSVLKHYLKSLDNEKINTAWQKFAHHFHNPTIQENIRNSKEEQYQEGFLRDLFVNILGYTLNPENNFNLTTELKNVKDSKKADGAIIIDSKVTSVIELKGTNTTDLSKIEEQAFGYKNNQENDCIYVITSNFEKVRFYIENAIDHIEFNLFQLNESQFKTLYICLSYESISRNLPKKLKDESLSREEKITKELYKDYANFRNDIFLNIQHQNPQYDKLTLFNKTQKLLDRFLFIFFAEDRLLLPPNSIREILSQWKDLRDKYDEYFPLYARFQKYFGYLNTGHKGKQHDIFAYNGGLFAPDDILDNIIIDDDILYNHTHQLSNYDFESEVSVNILGHIFENSLNEIDEIKAQLEGTNTENPTKRKKDGVFYTPRYITKYIVENTVGKLCEEKKIELQILDENYTTENRIQKKTKEALLQKLKDYRTWLLELTIVDPACGSGAFLNEALNFLIEQHRYLDELEAKLFGDALVLTDIENSILENNLFGVDINEESVEIAKLSLWLRTAQPNRKLNDLSNNIKYGNSLIDDPDIAGDKAFNWQQEFPHIFEKGGFDVVIGNPPYVRPRKIEEVEIKYFNSNFNSVNNQFDLYHLFIEKNDFLLNNNGICSFIVPNAFLSNENSTALRNFILNNFHINSIVDCNQKVFLDANVEVCVFIFDKSENEEGIYVTLKNNSFSIEHTFNQSDFKNNRNSNFTIKLNSNNKEIFRKIKANSVPLQNIFTVMGGIKEYQIGKGKPEQTKEMKDGRIFNSTIKFDESFYPEIRGKNLGKYLIHENYEFIKYGKWLAEPRDIKYFLGDKVLVRQIPDKSSLVCSFTDKDFIVDQTVYSIKNFDQSTVQLKYLLALLNSKLIFWIFRNENNEFDNLFPKIKSTEIKNLPIIFDKSIDDILIEKADQMLKLNKELQEISQKFQRSLQREFEIETLSKKLENWYELPYADFLKELKKKKVELNLSQKAEWEDYFLQQQQTALSIQTQITQTDKAIDQMVYQLYGLTPEEIEIVETN